MFSKIVAGLAEKAGTKFITGHDTGPVFLIHDWRRHEGPAAESKRQRGFLAVCVSFEDQSN